MEINQHTAFALGVMLGSRERREATLNYLNYADLRWLHITIPLDQWIGREELKGQELLYQIDDIFDPKQIEWNYIAGIALDLWEEEDDEEGNDVD